MRDLRAVDPQRLGKVRIAESVEHYVRCGQIDEICVVSKEARFAQAGKRRHIFRFNGKIGLTGIEFDQFIFERFRFR